jgi:Zn-dependent membrane protease YugP
LQEDAIMMMYMLMVMLPALVLSGLAAFYVKMTFSQYANVPAASGLSGAEAAEMMLRRSNVAGVTIEETQGFLSDHYDPTTKTLRLSPDVYLGRSLSAIGVACHEAGHALQHAQAYGFLGLRSAMVPMTSFCSYGSYILITIGMFISPGLALIGVIMFAAVVAFSFVTLPVEWDASRRAKECMVAQHMVGRDEANGVGSVLNAAFLTYVASAVTALLTLLYYLWVLGLIGGGRRDD